MSGGASAATIATVVGATAAVGGLAYTVSQGSPKVANPAAPPPQANPATNANSAAVGTAASTRARAAAGLAGGANGSGNPPGALATPPDTTHTSLLGGGS